MRARTLALMVMVTAVVGTASFAWACTAPSATNNLSSQIGAPGSRITVTAANFGATAGPREIRWNSISGPLLATAEGADFSVPVTVPADAKPGVYYIVALARGADGGFEAKVSQTFEVTASAAGASAKPDATGGASSFADERAPGLVGSSPDGRSSGMSAGVALLAVGLVALFSAFGALEMGRRRRLATRVEE